MSNKVGLECPSCKAKLTLKKDAEPEQANWWNNKNFKVFLKIMNTGAHWAFQLVCGGWTFEDFKVVGIPNIMKPLVNHSIHYAMIWIAGCIVYGIFLVAKSFLWKKEERSVDAGGAGVVELGQIENPSQKITETIQAAIDTSMDQKLLESLNAKLPTALTSVLKENLMESLATALKLKLPNSIEPCLEDKLILCVRTCLEGQLNLTLNTLQEKLPSYLTRTIREKFQECFNTALQYQEPDASDESLQDKLLSSLTTSLNDELNRSLSELLNKELPNCLTTSLIAKLPDAFTTALKYKDPNTILDNSLEAKLLYCVVTTVKDQLPDALTYKLYPENTVGASLKDAILPTLSSTKPTSSPILSSRTGQDPSSVSTRHFPIPEDITSMNAINLSAARHLSLSVLSNYLPTDLMSMEDRDKNTIFFDTAATPLTLATSWKNVEPVDALEIVQWTSIYKACAEDVVNSAKNSSPLASASTFQKSSYRCGYARTTFLGDMFRMFSGRYGQHSWTDDDVLRLLGTWSACMTRSMDLSDKPMDRSDNQGNQVLQFQFRFDEKYIRFRLKPRHIVIPYHQTYTFPGADLVITPGLYDPHTPFAELLPHTTFELSLGFDWLQWRQNESSLCGIVPKSLVGVLNSKTISDDEGPFPVDILIIATTKTCFPKNAWHESEARAEFRLWICKNARECDDYSKKESGRVKSKDDSKQWKPISLNPKTSEAGQND